MSRPFKRRFHETVDIKHSDLLLLIVYFITGLLDATSFNNWGVFVAMQTGNTIILALSTASLPETHHHSAATTLTSLGSFLLGAFLIAIASRQVNKHSRLFLSSCFLVQCLLLILAALLAVFDIVPEDPQGTGVKMRDILILSAIPPLACQFGVQMATARIIGFAELPTNVITSTYTDLMGDPDLFKLKWNLKRERRFASVVLMLGGAICDAWMMKKGCRVYVQIFLAAGLKLLIVLGIVAVIPAKKEAKIGESPSPEQK